MNISQTTSSDFTRSTTTIQYSGFQGTQRTVTVDFSPLTENLATGYSVQTLRGLYPELYGSLTSSAGSDTPNGLICSTITLADGSQYKLKYNAYRELSRIELPTGGAYEFTWASTYPTLPNGVNLTSLLLLRGVTEIREYSDGQTLSARRIINYSSTPPASGQQIGGSTTTVTEYDGAQNVLGSTKHYFYQGPLNSDPVNHNTWKDGLEFKTETYGAGVTPLKTISNRWQQGGTLPWPDKGNPYLGSSDIQQAYDPAISQVDTTLDNGMVSSVILGHDDYSNVNDQYEYDFGQGAPGALLRHTSTTYVPNSIYNTLPLWLVRLPTQQTVYAGASTLAGLTYYYYDDYNTRPLVDAPGISGHDPGMGTNSRCAAISRMQLKTIPMISPAM